MSNLETLLNIVIDTVWMNEETARLRFKEIKYVLEMERTSVYDSKLDVSRAVLSWGYNKRKIVKLLKRLIRAGGTLFTRGFVVSQHSLVGGWKVREGREVFYVYVRERWAFEWVKNYLEKYFVGFSINTYLTLEEMSDLELELRTNGDRFQGVIELSLEEGEFKSDQIKRFKGERMENLTREEVFELTVRLMEEGWEE